jgi:hypothetical protein
MGISKYWSLPLLFAVLCSVPVPASADIIFTGVFSADDQQAIFSFVASGAKPIISTTSYAGGGFNTDLALFGHTFLFPETTLQSNEPLIGQDANGFGDSVINTGVAPNNVNIVSGQTYWVVLTQYDNSANGPTFGDGFHEAGNPNFTAGFGCGPGFFCDPNTFTNRNNNWTLDFKNVASAQQQGSSVPEPSTFLLLGTVLAGVLATRRRKSGARQSVE